VKGINEPSRWRSSRLRTKTNWKELLTNLPTGRRPPKIAGKWKLGIESWLLDNSEREKQTTQMRERSVQASQFDFHDFHLWACCVPHARHEISW